MMYHNNKYNVKEKHQCDLWLRLTLVCGEYTVVSLLEVLMTEAGSRVCLPAIYRTRRTDAIGPQPYLGPARSQPAPMHPSHSVCPIKEIKEFLHYVCTRYSCDYYVHCFR